MIHVVRNITLIVVIFSCSYVFAADTVDSWKRTANILLTVDWLQTRDVASSNGIYSETNPILGTHPSIGSVNNYFLASVALLNLADYVLPQRYAKFIYQAVSIVEVSAVTHNTHIGVRLKF